MMNLTQDDLAKVQRYVSVAQDLQAYRGYDVQIENIQDDVRTYGHVLGPEAIQEWQKQITDLQQKQQQAGQTLLKTYNARSLTGLSVQLRDTEPLIERAFHLQQADLAQTRSTPLRELFLQNQVGRQSVGDYLQQHEEQPAPPPAPPPLTQPELVEKAYGLMQQEQQRRQGVRPQGGTNPSVQSPQDRVLEKRMEHAQETAKSRQETYDALAHLMSEKGREQLEQQERDSQQQAQSIQVQRHLQERNERKMGQMPPRQVHSLRNNVENSEYVNEYLEEMRKQQEQLKEQQAQQKQRGPEIGM